jgi:hypothetical protein
MHSHHSHLPKVIHVVSIRASRENNDNEEEDANNNDPENDDGDDDDDDDDGEIRTECSSIAFSSASVIGSPGAAAEATTPSYSALTSNHNFPTKSFWITIQQRLLFGFRKMNSFVCHAKSYCLSRRCRFWIVFGGLVLIVVLLLEYVALGNTQQQRPSMILKTYSFSSSSSSTSSSLTTHVNNHTQQNDESVRKNTTDHNISLTSTTLTNTTTQVNVIVQLSGETGNHLSKLAAGLGVAYALQRQSPAAEAVVANTTPIPHVVTANLLLRHQDHTTKWKRAVSDLIQCFPNLRNLNYSEAQSMELFMDRNHHHHQKMKDDDIYFQKINGNDGNQFDQAIHQAVYSAMQQQKQQQQQKWSANASSTTTTTTISTLTLYSDHLVWLDHYLDRFANLYREFFRFDESAAAGCCKETPDPDEIVFHFRNFVHEMPKKGKLLGYQEISPTDLVPQALAETTTTSKVAIVTRFPQLDVVQAYVSALETAGMHVRVLANQTSMQDFCFLMRTQYRLIGLARSTFFLWAGVLSNASIVTAYSMDSVANRAKTGRPIRDSYNFTNPNLAKRFRFELYNDTSTSWSDRDKS